MNAIKSNPPRLQQGVSTLLVAMLFLAILTVVALFGAKVGLSEQRTSGNEYRYKLAFQVAESGLGQAIEFMKSNSRNLVNSATGGWLHDGDPYWVPCTVSFSGAVDPCAQLPAAVAAGSYRYVGPTSSDKSGRLPLTKVQSGTVGGFASDFDAFATLCRLDTSVPGNPFCSLSPSSEGTYYVTITSVGRLTNENATASVRQAFGTFRLLGRAPDAPLIAAGTVEALGNSQLVPNPNAAGFGIPVSVWSKLSATIDQASFATCHLSSWLANGSLGSDARDSLVDGVCKDCTCNGLCPETGGLISGDAKSCAVAKDKLEGEDILDVDSNYSDASPKLRDSKYFPPDLFAYVFGIPGSNSDDYLNKNAKQVATCDPASFAGGGLFWYRGSADCDMGGGIVGSVQDPVVLVSDAPVLTKAGGQFFGIIFVRSKYQDGTPTPAASAKEYIKSVGGAQFYGAVLLDGKGSLAGNPSIVYNKAVLQNVLNSPSFIRYAAIPGTWSDTIKQ